ncbi:MAG: hypothetical protein E7012_01605 [Alphaproteobacteria bacterium]|nr:hypothetical protein [Alphaproteobacteria bacterium]
MIKEIINSTDCISFTSATDDDIKNLSAHFQECGLPPIPQSYALFLKNSNGFQYDGIEFYGTIEHKRTEKDYTFPSLLTANKDFSNYEFFSNKLLIGIMLENFIIFDSTTQKFAIVDAISLHTLKEFPDFRELIKTIL